MAASNTQQPSVLTGTAIQMLIASSFDELTLILLMRAPDAAGM